VDTSKAEVARVAVDEGAEIINDISAATAHPDMPDVARKSGAGCIG
jgi:dihydropteroate synthase